MIIAILDDGGVMVHRNLANAKMHHEGIAVEDGAVQFFDLRGRRVQTRFVEPNIRFVFVVASEGYDLHPIATSERPLPAAEVPRKGKHALRAPRGA